MRALCDRRAGIGGDGVLRVIRTAAYDASQAADAEWYMDYRNADGSVSEMCGNGIRVFARHLVEEGLADPPAPIPVATRDGIKVLTIDGDRGHRRHGHAEGARRDHGGGRRPVAGRPAHVDMGNPHAVAFVDDLADAGAPARPADPRRRRSSRTGVNVEFVVRAGERHVAMRVHERGSGETRSCGTGACAVMVAAAAGRRARRAGETDLAYRVDVPGGTLTVTWTADDRVLLTGPAVVVARGTTSL